ncbi:MAG: glycosyltransferase family 4 protein [Nitrososphaeraceae archaeon]
MESKRSIKHPRRIAYILKRYPRFSETFIVNEILSHELAGTEIYIFSLLPPIDTHFQDLIGRVKAPVTYLSSSSNVKGSEFWQTIKDLENIVPDIWTKLDQVKSENYFVVYQSMLLTTLLKSKNIDHIHAHFATSATSVARLTSLFSGIPYSFTAHAKDIYHNNVDYDDLRKKINDASAVITINEYNLKYLHDLFPEQSSNIVKIYNGLDLSNFVPNYNFKKTNNEIVSVGRLVEKKGFEILIEACYHLVRSGKKFHCSIIGTGILENNLRKKIKQLGLQNFVNILGATPREEMLQRIQDASIFVVPSIISNDGDRDGLPTTLLEAMAIGTPCISTDVTGIPEVIHDGVTGVIVPSKNPLKLAEAIDNLLSDYNSVKSLVKNANRLVHSKFNIHENSEQLRTVLANGRVKDKK